MRTRNRDGGKFPAGAPTRLAVAVVVAVVIDDDDDTFLVNNENLCRSLQEELAHYAEAVITCPFFFLPLAGVLGSG